MRKQECEITIKVKVKSFQMEMEGKITILLGVETCWRAQIKTNYFKYYLFLIRVLVKVK